MAIDEFECDLCDKDNNKFIPHNDDIKEFHLCARCSRICCSEHINYDEDSGDNICTWCSPELQL